MRWHEADTGATVPWYRNTLTPSPLDCGNSDSEIAQAMSAWTTPAGATISLAYGGHAHGGLPRRSSVAARRRSPAAASSPTRTLTTTSPPVA